MIYLQYNLFKSRITVYLNRNDWIVYSPRERIQRYRSCNNAEKFRESALVSHTSSTNCTCRKVYRSSCMLNDFISTDVIHFA